MVAANQKVTVTIAGSGFHDRAEISKPESGRWPVVVHNGSACAVASGLKADGIGQAFIAVLRTKDLTH